MTVLNNANNRASKSPDFAGDLPIFDKIMKISRSGMKISRFITRDSRLKLSIVRFAIAAGETIFTVWFAAPGGRHIRRDTVPVVPPAVEPGKPLFRAASDCD